MAMPSDGPGLREVLPLGFAGELGVVFEVEEKNLVVMSMPISERFYQPFGLVHGGVTLALIETAASWGATLNTDFDTEKPFGVEINVRHRKAAKSGMLRCTARLDRTEPSHTAGVKEFWDCTVTDDVGDVISEGTFVCKIVPLSYLEEKKREAPLAE